jgi:hypothetical protein
MTPPTEPMAEVRERLAAIETTLKPYNDTQVQAQRALFVSQENEKDISEIKDSLRWAHRTTIGLVVAGVVNIVFNLIQSS